MLLFDDLILLSSVMSFSTKIVNERSFLIETESLVGTRTGTLTYF